jgi:hypothetical protein
MTINVRRDVGRPDLFKPGGVEPIGEIASHNR